MAQTGNDLTRPGGATPTPPDATATDTHYTADGGDSERIRQDIRHTREAMHRTLEAIEGRFSPQRVWNEITGTFRDEVRRSRVLNALRTNPLPVMMLTAGAAWLGIDATRSREAGEAEAGEGAVSKAKPALGSARAKAAGAIGAVTRKAGHARGAVSKKMHKGGQSAQETASRLQQAAGRTRQAAGNARAEAAARFQEHPLTLGALAAAAGMAVGLLMPASRTEDELMGQAAGKARQRLRQTGEELADEGKQVGQAAAEAAGREAEKQQPAGPTL
ncbi:MAG: DUF3618 domain-containing protein [Planctomycetota bacterium]